MFQHIQHHTKTWLLLGICLLVLSSMPVRSALADVTISQSVDNSLTEFTRGKFQRASLGLLQDTANSPKLPDQPGAVQLGPIGILKNWKGETNAPLPKKLFRMGATAIGSRIYVVGGQTTTATGAETVADVISAPVNPTDGNIIAPGIGQSAWRVEPSLSAVAGSLQQGFTDAVAPINSAAVTSYAKTGGGGYIYVIGGNARIGTKDFSSFSVRVATVSSDGSIPSNGWRELTNAQIPDPDGEVNTFLQHGLQSSSAIMFTTGGKTFVYLVGGLQRYFEGTGTGAKTIDKGSASVFYAQVNPGNGNLYKPSSNLGTEGWEKLPDIPVSRETSRTDAGMWDATAFADQYALIDPDNTDTKALYIMGGQIAPDAGLGGPAVYTAATYIGLIQDDGDLFWSDWSGTLPAARFGHAGVTFRGNLYVTGGIPSSGSNNEPDKQMLSSYVEDSLELPSFGTSNFLENEVLPSPRAFHATVLIPAGNGSQNNAYVYMIGGRGDTRDADTSDDQGSDAIFFSSIGGDEDKSFGYPLTGWYYSNVFPINFANAELREINWATQKPDPAMDIEVDYRISIANTCDAPGFSDTIGDPNGWKVLTGTEAAGKRSANGLNTFPIENLPARCFQYRARLTSPAAGNNAATATPSLLNLAIEIIIPGSPDLKVETLAVVPGKTNPAAFGGLDTIITNKNAVEDTVAANAEKSGSFFVDLLVFEPGETVTVPTLPLSGADLARSRAFANVSRDRLNPDALWRINSWCDQAATTPGCVFFDQAKLITKVGKYTFLIVVDSTGCADKDPSSGVNYVCVHETSKGPDGKNVGETNNTMTVTYDAPPDPENPNQPLPPQIVPLPPLDPQPGAVCSGKSLFCLQLPLVMR